MSWQILVSVALGGALGATLRYLVSQWLQTDSGFPGATLLVNVTGSLLMGIGYVLLMERAVISEILRPLLLVGLLGGFTTFSSFAIESLYLFENGRTQMALAYIVLSVVLCILAAFGAVLLTRSL